jgi:anaerobic selenocysteine-containing dehydrogenase
MNPENARCLNLSAGDRVRVESAQKHIVADVELCSSIMKDVISLPHGWSGQLQVEKSGMTEGYPGTSFNDLTSSDDFDVLSGTSVLNSLVVKVSKGRADDVPAPP